MLIVEIKVIVDDAPITRVKRFGGARKLLCQRRGVLALRRHGDVKHQIHHVFPRHHPQVVDVRTWVLLAQNVVEMRRNAVKNRVADDNWVNVDANRNVQRTADVALRAVDNLVNRDEIRVGGYFRVNRRDGP